MEMKMASVYKIVGYCKKEDFLLLELNENHPELSSRAAIHLPKYIKAPMGDFLKQMVK